MLKESTNSAINIESKKRGVDVYQVAPFVLLATFVGATFGVIGLTIGALNPPEQIPSKPPTSSTTIVVSMPQ